ncbi:ribonuclease Oy-like [Amblyomma americanum]
MHRLALAVLLLASAGGLDASRSPHEPTVTYFTFSLQWSSGVCNAGHEKCIKEKERSFWTIHGLWPSSNTSDPQFCNRTLQYNATVLSPLVPQLDLYWPSVSEDNNKFWKHEWLKHGTCATMVPRLKGLYKFFNTTLNIYLQHNITEYLRSSGVVPTSERTYTLQEIKDALHHDIREAANFVCHYSKKYAAPVLAEIRFCLDRGLQPINCKVKHSDCDQGDVYYLASDASYGKGSATSLTSPLSWLLHFSWLLAISVVCIPHCAG